jgi:hypothetical protein
VEEALRSDGEPVAAKTMKVLELAPVMAARWWLSVAPSVFVPEA